LPTLILVTSLGNTAETKIKLITKEINALICLVPEPKTLVFSKTAKSIKNISKKGYTNLVKSEFCKKVTSAITSFYSF